MSMIIVYFWARFVKTDNDAIFKKVIAFCPIMCYTAV